MASILWFRKGLRLHDNPALLDACTCKYMYPVFVIDPHFLKKGTYRVGVNRYNFLLESLTDLDNSLKARGSRLLVMRGTPEEVLPKAFKDWGITRLCFEIDTEPYAKMRDEKIKHLASVSGVEDTSDLVKRNGGRAPLTYQSFIKLVGKLGPPPAPAADPPYSLPGQAPGAKGTEPEATNIPTWKEMGFETAPSTLFKGGETEALKRLKESLSNISWVAAFEKPQTDPSAFEKPSTTILSPYLKFGCLSARLFHSQLLQVYKQAKKHSQPPVSLEGQLLWREFFYTVGAHTVNFNKMSGNPICRQIDWEDNDAHLAAWSKGRTGFPWIDAIMIQLREWGWIHHLARHSVACFLTRGDLYISWERGQEVFEELLIDQDYFLNAGNWMWLSASAFFSQYFRVYSPVVFGRKYDPDGKYIKKFLPVLQQMPSKYIYEPWLAPIEVQRKAGCIIGQDYPSPIVDHASASKACIARIGAAYKASRPPMSSAEDGDDDENLGAGASGSSGLSKKKSASSSSKKAVKEDAGKAIAPSKRQKSLLESGFKTLPK